MKEVKYIPGDLVIINNITNVIDGIYPKSFSKDRIIEAHAIEGDNTNRYRYDLDFGKIVSIVPIKLTPAILEANGWLKIVDKHSIGYQHPKYLRLQVQVIDSSDKYAAYLNDEFLTKLSYVHQLQHLLFGLGLPMNLKV